jgi:DNA-binding CsgD family transcriptional regulator
MLIYDFLFYLMSKINVLCIYMGGIDMGFSNDEQITETKIDIVNQIHFIIDNMNKFLKQCIQAIEILHGKIDFTGFNELNLMNHIQETEKNNEPQYFYDTKTSLTVREKQCLYYFLKGFSAKTTARELQLSHRTVEFYISRIKKKYKCKNLREVIHRLS